MDKILRLLGRALIGCLFVSASHALLSAGYGQDRDQKTNPPAASQRTEEELAELSNWITIVKNPNVALDQRVFFAKELISNEWPEAQQEVLALLNNSEGSGVCIPVCRAIAQNGPAQIKYVDPIIILLSDSDEAVREAAAGALAQYEDESVVNRLAAIAQDQSATNPTRSSAILTLAQLKDTQRSIGILISLLDDLNGSLDSAIFSALTKLTGINHDHDPDAWKRWWEGIKHLSREQQQKRQLEILKQQIEQRDAQLETYDQRYTELLEQYFHRINNGEKVEQLRKYLVDELECVRFSATRFIQTAIGEGNLPDQSVVDVLRSRLTDPSACVRKGVLNILGHLRNSADAPAVVDLLSKEQNEAVCLAAIETLGELSNMVAIPILIEHLDQPGNTSPCAESAAKSLGRLNARGKADPSTLSRVVTSLLNKYETATPNPELRIALLHAMSSIADAAFVPMLTENLQHEQADVRLRCTKGLTLIGQPKHLDLILPLLTDPDAGVRQEAAAAIGKLSREEAHLNALFNRMNPDAEPDAAVRQTVWQSFVEVWAAQKPETQLAWTQKLGDDTEHQMELLKNLEERLARSSPPSPLLLKTRELLATLFYELSRYADAAKYWEMVEQTLYQASDPTASQVSFKLFRALTRSGAFDQALVQAQKLLTADLVQFRPKICDDIITYLGEEKAAGQKERISTFLNILKAKLPNLLDEAFKERLAPFEEANVETATQGAQSPSSDHHSNEQISKQVHSQ